MLDTETKRRIDTARDILLGKIPDPKSQVEQITIALIYKFMDDMDAESEELGGKRQFFTGDFASYGWAKLMHSGLGGHETLQLYAEAITKIPENPGVPLLFRDIFKNAFLPYRDPPTLKSFLKIIDEFNYDHSERLGDAFEYLLSVLGAQGDAGQFRTPRHIIDFMVAVIDPKKEQSILDPACGTAGFLISAWKHILRANSKEGRKGASLTPDERKRLTENIQGYDISPDMVRLSLVNLYLHGFTAPHISEYDTLTSEDKWNETADIILANPPFMSPKGGIKPHKRFSVQAKRSEVLFVDYIAEHLTPNGRAAVVVPEGIIFQSQNAYKQLRKMLVENYLYAVVSLPAGVFNPYSGVKTSILLIDKTLAKKRDSILFVKVENDGFDLGAQRRKIEQNDLPKALETIQEFIYMDTQDGQDKKEKSCLSCLSMSNALIVKKEKIGENGEWNLGGERYRERSELQIGNYEFYKLKEIATIRKGTTITKKTAISGEIPVIAGGQSPAYYHNFANREGKQITVSSSGAYAGFINYFDQPIFASDCTTIQSDENKLKIKFLYHLLKIKQEYFYTLQKGGAQPHVYGKDFGEYKIPLPPLKIQQEIVAEIEGYQKIIDGARAVVDNYKPQIHINPDWEMVKLGEETKIVRGGSPRPIQKFITDGKGINWIKIGDVAEGEKYITKTKQRIIHEGTSKTRLVKGGDFLLSNSMSFGRPYIVRIDGAIHDGWLLLRINNKTRLFQDYLYYVLGSNIVKSQYEKLATGGVVRNLNSDLVKSIEIPLPPLETQTKIAAQIEKEQSLVNANKELITLFEQKIKDKIASVRGE